MKTHESYIPIEFPQKAITQQDEFDESILLLHGFNQDAQKIMETLSPALPKNKKIISLQAPLPIPMKRKEQWHLGYSWYIFNHLTNEFLYPMNMAVDISIKFLVAQSWLESIQTVIGFSQGGYIAPFISQHLPRAQQVVGINCRFRHEELENSDFPFELIAIHGEEDAMVNSVNAILSYKKVIQDPLKHNIHVIKDSGHFIDSAILDELKLILS